MEKVFDKLLTNQVQEFINNNISKNPSELALKFKEVEGVPIQYILQQIQGKQKAKSKLPLWSATPGIIFPPTLNLEQSSSEATAEYKSSLISGDTIVDLTGGFGIDTTFFSEKLQKVFYIERNKELSEIVQQNLKAFGIKNVEIHNVDGESFLNSIDGVDAIYIDPARRDQNNKKVFKLEDCEPNIVNLLPELLRKCSQLLIKTSPLLDIKASLKDLGRVSEIHVIAVDNDCKEVLYLIRKENSTKDLKITTVNIQKERKQIFEFLMKDEESVTAPTSLPLNYLYEPNAAIFKAGAFNSIARHFNVFKLHSNSHLYTSEEMVENFPGRKFKITGSSKYDKKTIHRFMQSVKANITTRNFPDSVDQIRKKLGLKDGGDVYFFATTDLTNKPVIIVTEKVE